MNIGVFSFGLSQIILNSRRTLGRGLRSANSQLLKPPIIDHHSPKKEKNRNGTSNPDPLVNPFLDHY